MNSPFENDTSKIIKKLAIADLRSHKLKTFLCGIVILIATCLMSTVFTFLFNDAMNRANSTPYHAMYNAVNNNTKNALLNDTSFEKVGIYKNFGSLVTENERVDISYMDVNTLEFSGYELLEGKMPKAKNEVLVSAQYLKNHNLKKTLGSIIPFSYTDALTNKSITKHFIVSGIIKNDNMEKAKEYSLITSDAYRLQIAANKENITSSNFNSQKPDSVDVLVRLNKENAKLSEDSQKDLFKKIGTNLNIKSYNIFLNYRYINGIFLEPTNLIILVFFTLLIMLASSLVIYSIFYISVVNSIKTYAQMISLGTTARQLKRFLKIEGNILLRRFIPLGIIISLLITLLVSSAEWILYDLLLTLVVSLLVVIIVKLSLKKPSKILESLSPIEAMKYTDNINAQKRKTIKNITPRNLAKTSLKVNRKKNRISIISLSISGILIISMAIFMNSTNLKEMMLQYYPLNENFMIGIHLDNYYERFPQFAMNNPFTEDLISEVKDIKGVEKVTKSEAAIGTIIEPDIFDLNGKRIKESITGITPLLLKNKGKLVDGDVSYEALGKDGIILNQLRIDTSSYDYKNIKVGDKLKFKIVSGDTFVEKEFHVIGIAYFNESSLFYTSQKNIESLTPYNGTTHISIFVKPENHEQVQIALKNIISQNPDLTLKVYKEEYSTMKNFMHAIMWSIYGICLFILFFGILNMLNILITSAIMRKHEFALLQAVGMTRKQLRQMLYREGLNLSLKSAILSAIFGVIFGKYLCYLAYEVMSLKFIHFHFSLWPILIFTSLLVGIQLSISTLICRNIEKETLTERLRSE